MNHPLSENANMQPVGSAFISRMFVVLAILALCSLAIFAVGKVFGRSIALGGHTHDTRAHEIVIGNNVLKVPANAIRDNRQRRSGLTNRLDLYGTWPELHGYTHERAADFNHLDGSRKIIFLSFHERHMLRDMSARFDPIYRQLIVEPGIAGPQGLTLFGFNNKAGYLDELLAVGSRPGTTPFAARCLAGEAAERSLSPCERDVHVGDGLTLTYRFPKELLSEWRALDARVLDLSDRLIQRVN